MPMRVHYRDDQRQRIRWTASAPLQLAEVMALLDRQIVDGGWRYALVIDLRQGALAGADRDALFAHIQALTLTHGAHGPVALVARDFEVVGGAEVFARRSAAKMQDVQVFWDVDDADNWLDSQVDVKREGS